MIETWINDSGIDSDNINKGYGAKMTYTQDKLGMLVNHKTIILYRSPGLRLGD